MAGIYAIELTNHCNAKCDFCPHDKMGRDKGFILMQGIEICIDYMLRQGQKYVALHHMGEPLLHKDLFEILKKFADAGIDTEFSTNGMLLDKFYEMPIMGQTGCEIQQPALSTLLKRLRISVDYFYSTPRYLDKVKEFLDWAQVFCPELKVHIHTIKGHDLSMFEKYNVVLEHKIFDNWAGKVEGVSQLPKTDNCYFINYNYVVVAWDGRILKCCMDTDAEHVKGNIYTNGLETLSPNTRCSCICASCASMQFANGGEWDKIRRD